MADADNTTAAGDVSPAWDGRFEAAEELIKQQRHRTEEPPRDGGRWPVSAALLPDPASAVSLSLERLMIDAAELAGPDHWRTGRPGTAHLTLRALERRRAGVTAEDADVQRYARALQRAADGCDVLEFDLRGLIATPGTIMVPATPTDGGVADLAARFAAELGQDRWLEESLGERDLWYVNLLHFAGPIADPVGLVDWVNDRRTLSVGTVVIDQVQLIRWDYHWAGSRCDLWPVPLATFRLGER